MDIVIFANVVKMFGSRFKKSFTLEFFEENFFLGTFDICHDGESLSLDFVIKIFK